MNKKLYHFHHSITLLTNTIKISVSFSLILFHNVLISQTTWDIFGNSIQGTEFLGTINNKPLVFKTYTIERARIAEQGNFGIGISTPQHILHVHDNRLITPTIIDITQGSTNKTSYAYSAFQLTNYKTGITDKDGILFYTNDNNGGIHLQEQGKFELRTGNSIVTLHPDNKCSFFNSGASDASVYIFSLNNNGLNIKLHLTANNQVSYGLNIESNKSASDLMRGSLLNKIVYKLNGKGEAYFGQGVERITLGNTQSLGDKYATGYIGFNITRENNVWKSNHEGANNGAVLIYADIAGGLRIVTVPSTGATQSQKTDTDIRNNTRVTITRDGNVGIGTETPGLHKLAVEGIIGARRVRVTEVGFGADFVFCPSYKLKPLSEVEDFVKEHLHLPDVPSEAQMQSNGLDLTEMNILLLQKIEELYLYVFELEKKVNELSK